MERHRGRGESEGWGSILRCLSVCEVSWEERQAEQFSDNANGEPARRGESSIARLSLVRPLAGKGSGGAAMMTRIVGLRLATRLGMRIISKDMVGRGIDGGVQ